MKQLRYEQCRFKERIKGYDAPITISKAEDFNLDYPYAIDVEDGSFFYPCIESRDEDFEVLRLLLPCFSFVG